MKKRFWIIMLLAGIISINISVAVEAGENSEVDFSDDSIVMDSEDMLEDEVGDEIIDNDALSQESNIIETIEPVGANSDWVLYSENSEVDFSDDNIVIDSEDMFKDEADNEITDNDTSAQGNNAFETIEFGGENSDWVLYSDKIQNNIELNTYYNASELGCYTDWHDKKYEFLFDIPESGRIKVLLEDCPTEDLSLDYYFRYNGENGYESREWKTRAIENADTGWISVTPGSFEFCLKNSVTLNRNAKLMVYYQSSGQYYGEIENNDSFDNATYMEPNVEYEGNWTKTRDVDIYKLSMLYPGLVQISTASKNGSDSFDIYEEDENGNVFLINRFFYSRRLRLDKGNYYIKIEPAVVVAGNEYTLRADVTYEPADGFEHEKNNVKSQANKKSTNVWYTGNLNDEDDIDSFEFNVSHSSKMSMEFRIPRQIQQGIIQIAFYDKDYNLITSAKNTSNPYLKTDEKLYKPGMYYIRISGGDFNDDYSFCLNQTIVHQWDNGTVVMKPTCISEGRKIYTCLECEENRTEIISQTEHKWGSWRQTIAPTISHDGEEERECSICHRIDTRKIERLNINLDSVVLNNPRISVNDNIQLDWRSVKGADGYIVYRKESGKWERIAILNGNILKYTDTNTKIGNTYRYTVKAFAKTPSGTIYGGYNKQGVSIQQKYYKNPLVILSADAVSAKAVRVRWSARKKNTGYIIYRKTAGTSWKRIKIVQNVTEYTDSTCQSATTYYYTIRAYTKNEGVYYYSPYMKNGLAVTTNMLMPTVKAVSNIKNTATVSWSRQSGINGYVIYRKSGTAGKWKRIKILSAIYSSYTEKGLTSGSVYIYSVRPYKKITTDEGIMKILYGPYQKAGAKVRIK